MEHHLRAILTLSLIASVPTVMAQFVNTAGVLHTNGATNCVIIGNNTTAGIAAFTIRGQSMPTPTGEVFRTNAPVGSDTYWRLARNNVEYGHLFNLSSGTDFNLGAPEGELRYHTSSLLRMAINATQGATINGYTGGGTGLHQNGYVGISNQPLFFTSGPGPFSRLHLCDSTSNGATNYAQELGYRPWMRNGATFTGNADQGYVGQKFATDDEGALIPDRTDMVVHWSNDMTEEYGPDYLRFIFTASPNGSSVSGARSVEGLEGMRLYEVVDLNWTGFRQV